MTTPDRPRLPWSARILANRAAIRRCWQRLAELTPCDIKRDAYVGYAAALDPRLARLWRRVWRESRRGR